MCGISGFYLRDPDFRVNQDALLDTLLLGIEDRGKHATGFVAIGEEGTLEWQKAACPASTFIKHRRLIPDGARSVIAHTRWATQGLPAFMENNHPIKRGPFYIIHNGHVHNDGTLFKDAERDRFGDVDSEAIAARLSYYGDLKYLGNVIEEIDGDAAVAAVDERTSSKFTLVRGQGSPLHIYNGKRIVIFASSELTVKKAYEKHVGRLGKEGVIWAKQGQMFFWSAENEYWTKDLILPKPKYGWSDWDDKDWTPSNTAYTGTYSAPKSTTTTNGKAITEEEEKARQDRITQAVNVYLNKERMKRYGFASDDDEYDYSSYSDGKVECDNCSKEVEWNDTFDYYDLDSRYTFQLCPDCYEFYNAADEAPTLWSDPDQRAIGPGDTSDSTFIMVDGERVEIVDGEIVDLDYDSDIVDDYCGANSAVLRMLDEDDQNSENAIVRMIDRIRSSI